METKPPFSDPAKAREAGRKGQAALQAKRASEAAAQLTRAKLGKLETFDDARRWLEAIGAAVVLGHLDNRDAQAGIRAVETWLKAEGERVKASELDELREQIAELKGRRLKAS